MDYQARGQPTSSFTLNWPTRGHACAGGTTNGITKASHKHNSTPAQEAPSEQKKARTRAGRRAKQPVCAMVVLGERQTQAQLHAQTLGDMLTALRIPMHKTIVPLVVGLVGILAR